MPPHSGLTIQSRACFSRKKMKWLIVLAIGLTTTQGIVTKGGQANKIADKSDVEAEKKDDRIDAQASHSHSVYGPGFGDNGLDGGFGREGLGSFGDGGFGYGDHGHDHHLDHHHHYYHNDYHKESHHDGGYHKALAIKGLLVPLAGVALLGAAAAFVSNPILLQLGVISGTYGRRRRRETDESSDFNESAARLEAQTRLSRIKILERFMAQVPKDQMYSQEKKLMASYLTCSGITQQENACLERLACELHGPGAKNMPDETHVMSIVTNEIFNNDLVSMKTKEQMAEAVRRGREGGDCAVYRCSDLEALIREKQE